MVMKKQQAKPAGRPSIYKGTDASAKGGNKNIGERPYSYKTITGVKTQDRATGLLMEGSALKVYAREKVKPSRRGLK